MKAIIQRVNQASVKVDNQILASIQKGIVVLLGIKKDDNQFNAEKMIKKILTQRIFQDIEDKMNLSVSDINGEILIVSNFTIYGDTKKGTRPSYTQAAKPKQAKVIYDHFINQIKATTNLKVVTGEFQKMMKVSLINDGPVTIILET